MNNKTNFDFKTVGRLLSYMKEYKGQLIFVVICHPFKRQCQRSIRPVPSGTDRQLYCASAQRINPCVFRACESAHPYGHRSI